MDLLAEILYTLRDHQELVDKDENLAFFNYCLKIQQSWGKEVGQNFQAAWVMYELQKAKYEFYDSNNMSNLFYVDFGAASGYEMSNTNILRGLGAGGILAEPNPAWHKELEYRRNHNTSISHYCVSDTTGDLINFVATEDPLHSTMEDYIHSDYNGKLRENNAKTIRVPTITLYDLLKQYNAPDKVTYLSIDTEGSELDILNKFFKENDKYDIKMITVEHNFTPNREKIYNLLTSNGYKRKFEMFSRWDDFYIREKN